MTRYSPRQVAQIAAGGGFRGKALTRAVAVALAESGGNSQAVNVNSDATRSRDRGLWQINSRWHPEVSDAQAFNPTDAARAAFRISSGGRDWSPWAAWPTAAGAQLGRARIAVAQVQQAGGVQNADWTDLVDPFVDPFGIIPEGVGPDDLVSGASDIVGVLKQLTVLQLKAGAWMSDPHNWLRVAWMVGGAVGVLIALTMIGKSGAAGDVAKKAAALPGKAAKATRSTAMIAGTGGTGAVAKGAAAAGKASKVAAAGKAAA